MPTPPDSPLLTPVEQLDGVGPTRAAEFHALGVLNLGDLMEYFPRDYVYLNAERPISQLAPDAIQYARGQVVAVDYVTGKSRPRFEATLDDTTGKLALVFFNGAYLRRQIHPGLVLRVQGPIKFFRGLPQMANPKWEKIEPEAAAVGEDRLAAVYPATAKLPSDRIAAIVSKNIDSALPAIPEWFPEPLLQRHGLMPRSAAYRAIHEPTDTTEAWNARRRLVYDELMMLQIGLGLSRRFRSSRLTAPVLRIDKLLDQRIRNRFPFSLTNAQQRSIHDIIRDVQADQPMSRLLQGDVGSGKTVVALYAMLLAVANRLQATLLAPTEVLAEQHYLTLNSMLKDSSVSIELFTQRTKRESKGALLKHLADGRVHIAIGTQALLQEDIEFANLGLVVVDEQHKLGVRQRAQLKNKGLAPHYLIMTATPIPRTLALSYFADFDVSTLDELPPGRQPIKTRWIKPQQSDQAYQFVRQEIAAGRQAYVVLPQIDDDGTDDIRSVTTAFEHLSTGPLKSLRLAILHGQMRTTDKQAVMKQFRDAQLDVLIATTVIEVGVDVPNATVMVIESADRFGLSQLHQIRGRVGRGTHLSHCLLIADPQGDDAIARLRAMCQTNDGFEIAEEDLKLRGPGDFFGTAQHGLPRFKLADISQELEMLHQAKDDALELLTDDPNLSTPPNAPLRQAVAKRFGQSLAWAQVG